MTNIVPLVPEKSCNTRQISPSKHWCFTLNNHTEDDICELLELKGSNSSIKWVFQEETGENGTPHLQGYIDFGCKVRPKSKLKNERIHWEKCRSIEKSIAYCSKTDTRTGRVFTHGIRLPKPLKLISDLRPWQKQIVDMVDEEPDDRIIWWYYDKKGNTGKSALVKYLCFHKQALLCSGRATDIKYLIVKYREKYGVYPDIILYDIPRDCLDYVSYTGMEEIKNGCFASTKYECEMVLMNCPHIVCFANQEPKYESMSEDRWKVIKIKN